MIMEMPLPIPCSVINSPIHMRMVEPATIETTETIQSIVEGVETMEVFEETTD